MIDIKAPALQHNSSFLFLKQWSVNEGDTVEEGQVLAEIQQGMEVIKITAPSSGTLSKILIGKEELFSPQKSLAKFTCNRSKPKDDTIILSNANKETIQDEEPIAQTTRSEEVITIKDINKAFDQKYKSVEVEDDSTVSSEHNVAIAYTQTDQLKDKKNKEDKKDKEVEEDKIQEIDDRELQQAHLKEEKLEEERLEEERLEKEALEQMKLKKELKDKQRLEQKQFEKEKLEEKRLAKEELERQKLEEKAVEKQELAEDNLSEDNLPKDNLAEDNLPKDNLAEEVSATEKPIVEDVKDNDADDQKLEPTASENVVQNKFDSKSFNLSNSIARDDTHITKERSDKEADRTKGQRDYEKTAIPSTEDDNSQTNNDQAENDKAENDKTKGNPQVKSLSKKDDDLNTFIENSPSYAVMLGLSGIGKSSGLQMILQTWYGGVVPKHILDLGQTETGQFNPIPVHTKDGQQVMLVDVAGEDFRSWLIDNDCQGAVEPMSHFKDIQSDEKVGSSYEVIRDNFERLLKEASYIYIMVPSNDLGIDGVYSPHRSIDECARAVSEVMHAYDKNKRVTFLVNHTDELLTLKTQNAGKPYYYAMQEDGRSVPCCPVTLNSNVQDIDLNNIFESIKKNYNNLIKNYLDLIYRQDDGKLSFNDTSLKEYDFVGNSNLNFKLNSLMTRSVNPGSPFEYECLVILYPIHLFIKRKVEEHKEALLKEGKLNPADRTAIATINRSFNHLFANQQYQQAIEHLTTVILTAFAIDELQLPELLAVQQQIEQEIQELKTIEEKIKKRIHSVSQRDFDAILNIDINQDGVNILTAEQVKEKLKQLDSKFTI